MSDETCRDHRGVCRRRTGHVAAFAARRCPVALIARGETGLRAAAREVEAVGGQAMVLPLDVANAEKVVAAADAVVQQWGGIDVWINCAMATIFAPVSEISPDEFRRVTEVTYLGQVHGTMAALNHMRGCGSGTIVQVGSALSYRAIPLRSAYCGANSRHRQKSFSRVSAARCRGTRSCDRKKGPGSLMRSGLDSTAPYPTCAAKT
jgi:NAD(P)-dependent dehydrogenase (short-subunit alcohol dehydrogenase family)